MLIPSRYSKRQSKLFLIGKIRNQTKAPTGKVIASVCHTLCDPWETKEIQSPFWSPLFRIQPADVRYQSNNFALKYILCAEIFVCVCVFF